VKPHYQIPIRECGEPLVPIPLEQFAVERPHPYEKLGAPYGNRSPYYVRQTVLDCLIAAQVGLQENCPGWCIQIFDAYRPIAVQQFMVDYSLVEMARSQDLDPAALTATQRQALLEQVYQFWALPSADPAMPPPHSTGAALDVTLVDEAERPVNMGSPIDELSARSHPTHFEGSADPAEQQFHHHRQLLANTMLAAGFHRHPLEWWHFCYGDQMWAWLENQAHPDRSFTARYGRAN